jgi:hypothetical protein
MAIGEAISFATNLIGSFIPDPPTPEEQRKKAGVWYNMFIDWNRNKPSNEAFISTWQNMLPFRQTKTKKNFMNNQIRGKSFDEVANVLIDKINDELIKGGLPRVSKDMVLDGVGISGGSVSGSGMNVNRVSPGLGESSFISDDPNGDTESKSFFLFAGLGAIALAIGLFNLFGDGMRKKRRR